MALINRSSIPALLRPGLKTVFTDYNTFPDLYREIYKVQQSDKATEYDLEMQGLGLAQIKQDGGPVAMGNFQQGYTTYYNHQWYGLGFQITRAAIEDNLYEAEFNPASEQLRISMQTLRNTNATYIFNNGFTANATVSDGKPLFSVDHPIATGQLANTFANPVGFNESAIEDALTMIKLWKNLAGIPINLSAKSLLVPPRLQFQASRLLNSTQAPGTANNDINVLKHDRYLPGGYTVNPFLTNPYNWFILTDETVGFKWFQRSNIDFDFKPDIYTDNTIVRAVERYSCGCSNWRAAFGVQSL